MKCSECIFQKGKYKAIYQKTNLCFGCNPGKQNIIFINPEMSQETLSKRYKKRIDEIKNVT